MQRKQFPGILAHAITIHKSQGSTYEFMKCSMNKSFNPAGMAYTMLSRAKNRAGIKLDNFKSHMIKTNEKAVNEMNRMREESLLNICNPLLQLKNPVILLLNIRSWNCHIDHILNDPIYLINCSILCFTETKVQNTNTIKSIDQLDSNWHDIHLPSEHGLTICYQKNKIQFICQLEIDPFIEALACKFKYEQTEFIIILLYRKPGTILNYYMQQISEQLRVLRHSHSCRMILLGDFNIDQRLETNINRFAAIKQTHKMEQKTKYTTHVDGGILDLIFDIF
jgi:hypothetical protein